jgi:PhnB protein
MQPTIYLFFQGNCLEAMTHYAAVLGGEIGEVFRNGDAPDAESRMPGGDDLVMNMTLSLGGATVMASDAPAPMYDQAAGLPGAARPALPRRVSTPLRRAGDRRPGRSHAPGRNFLGRAFRHVHGQVRHALDVELPG